MAMPILIGVAAHMALEILKKEPQAYKLDGGPSATYKNEH
jgi:hypothetical protein